MRTTPLLVAFAALCAACNTSPRTPPFIAHPPPGSIVLSIVGTSDLHGHLERGVAFSGYVENLRKTRSRDGGVVLVDAGDMFQGTIAANETEGAAVIRLYNAIGYHAAAIGNHEFDYGPVGPAAIPSSPSDDPRGALLAAVKLARFPVLNANLFVKDTGYPIQWPGVTPSTLIDVAGVKVGIVGVTTIDTLKSTNAANVGDLKIGPLEEAITAQARSLRQQGAKVVVVAAHAGGGCWSFDNPDDLSSCMPDQETSSVARSIDPKLVDVIVGGHTHRAIAHRVNGIPVIQSKANGAAFGRVDLYVNPASGEVRVAQIHPPHAMCEERDDDESGKCTTDDYEGAPVVPTPQARAAVAQDLATATAKSRQPVGVTLTARLKSRGSPSSPLGDQIASWMLEARPSAQVAYVNIGGVRKDLPEGPLTYGAFFETLPFDNRFASATVKVASLRKLFVRGLRGGRGFSVAGVRVVAKCGNQGIEADLLLGDRPLRDDESVVLLTSDYLATTPKLSEAGIPPEAFRYEEGRTIRDALVDHLRKKGGTVRAAEKSPISSPHGTFPLPCSR